MVGADDREKAVLAALERETRINIHSYPISVAMSGEDVIMEGEVESPAAKKTALEIAAAVPGVAGIVDRLRVKPAMRMEDGEIADHVARSILHEKFLEPYSLVAVKRGEQTLYREGPSGSITIDAADGVVTLSGEVMSLSQKRLAGVCAWWVPGTRDVVNALAVEPREEDTEGDIIDAIRLTLERDPLVDASGISVRCRGRRVTLDGVAGSEAAKRAAETDSWFVFGVDTVENRITVID